MDNTTNNSVYYNAYEKVMQLVRDSDTGNRLPPETKLAEQIGVSRVTIRDILAEMEAHGYISRQRGKGTIVNREITKEKARLDMENMYTDMIQRCGYKPSCFVKSIVRVDDPEEEIQNALQIQKKKRICLIRKIVSADNKPVLYINDYIQEKFFDMDNLDIGMIARSTYKFVQEHSGKTLDSSISHVETITADSKLADIMKISAGTALLVLKTTAFDTTPDPLIYSVEYINTQIIPFSIQRRLTRRVY